MGQLTSIHRRSLSSKETASRSVCRLPPTVRVNSWNASISSLRKVSKLFRCISRDASYVQRYISIRNFWTLVRLPWVRSSDLSDRLINLSGVFNKRFKERRRFVIIGRIKISSDGLFVCLFVFRIQ